MKVQVIAVVSPRNKVPEEIHSFFSVDTYGPVLLANLRPGVQCRILFQQDFNRWVKVLYDVRRGDEHLIFLLSHDTERKEWTKLEIIEYKPDKDWIECNIPEILC